MTLYYDDNRGTDSFSIQDFEPSSGMKLSNAVREAWLESYGPVLTDFARSQRASGEGPRLSAVDATERIKGSGLKLDLTPRDGQYTEAQLDLLIERQRELTMVRDVRERTPWSIGSPVRGLAMFGAGILDPINLATAFVPWTRTIPAAQGLRAASMSTSLATRTLGRAGVGGIDAGISTAVLEPAYFGLRQALGDDYTAVDSMINIGFGTLFGGGVHTVGGAGVDAFRRYTGRAQPFDRFEGLSVDEIQLVEALRADIDAGMDARDVQRVLDTYTPEMRRAAGFPDATPATPEAAGEGAGRRLSEMPESVRQDVGTAILTRDAYTQTTPYMDAWEAAGRSLDDFNETQIIEVLRGIDDLRLQVERINPQTVNDQGRAVSDAVVEQYRKMLDDGDAPPILVRRDADGNLEVIEGGHRLQAAKRAGRDEIDAVDVTDLLNRSPDDLFAVRPPNAAETTAAVSPETREATLRTAVAQSAEGRFVDIDAIMGTDEAAGGMAGMDQINDAAARNRRPEAIRVADFEASAAVDERNATAPKWEGLADAEAAAAEADAMLADTVAAGDQAFKYSRGRGGADKPGVGVVEGNKLGFEPDLRVKVPLGRIKQPEKPLLLTGTTNKNAARQIDAIDGILKKFPKADETPEDWSRMLAYAFASDEVPVPPYAFLRDINTGNAANKLRSLTPGQIADADHGFKQAAEFRSAYVGKELDVVVTGKLFMWSFLSRGVSPYTQEALFIDAFPGVDEWIRKAAAGDLTEADFPAYEAWAKSVAPAGSGQPGAGATHNLNAFGKSFLFKMGQKDENGVSHIQRLHAMMEDPNATGAQIRREFMKFGEGVGIDNKVVSFTLLVAGFDDVMVLDRVQIRQLWDDGRFNGKNLYDGRTDENGKPVTGSALSDITYGARGLLIYEAVERALQKHIKDIYAAIGREADASVGRFHWDSWVADSQQEASHGTLSAILPDARGDNNAIANVTAKQGEYGAYEYGAMYGRGLDGVAYFAYNTPDGRQFEFSVPAFRAFLADIKKPGTGVVPGKFKVTESGNAPWYTRPEVNQQRLTEVADQYADRARGQGSEGGGEGARPVQEAGVGQAVSDDAGSRYARGTEPGLRADVRLSETLRLAFGDDTQALVDAGQVRVVSRPDEIPGGPHPADVKAATAPDGTVYIVAENVSPAEARGLLLHEVGVHVGMEQMLGPQVFGEVLTELDGAIARGEAWAQAARSAVPADTLPMHVREEQLAYLVQNAPELPIVQRILAAVRAWAYRTFQFARENMTLTEADFRAMAVSALHHAARGRDVPAGQGALAFARDVAQTGTKAFRDWFGDSKVIGPDGEPLVVYHGTGRNFTKFKGATFSGASFFTSNPEIASGYAANRSDGFVVRGGGIQEGPFPTREEAEQYRRNDFEGGRISAAGNALVYPVYLSVKNPLVVDAGGAGWNQLVVNGENVTSNDLPRLAKAGGHDGVIVQNVQDNTSATDGVVGDVFLTLKATQIKSATGNRGTFDPANPDIRYTRDPGPATTPAADLDRAWRDLTSVNKFSDFDTAAETKVSGGMDEFVLSRTQGNQWAALTVREFTLDDGSVVYSSSLEVGMNSFPSGTGAATTMYLQALNIAQKRGMGWMSEGVRSDAAVSIYNRLTNAGIPFEDMGLSSFISAEDLAKVDLNRVGDSLASTYGGRIRYARGETPDPKTEADAELKRYDEAVARAKSYAKVLRAAADKLDDDAQATAAMRAALPDISPVEIDELLTRLRSQVKGLRGMARSARTAMGAEDQASALQSEAMRAADMLANNLEMAAVIEKRNASLNIAARLKATSFVNQFRAKSLDFEGFAAMLVGSERVRQGSRVSIDAEYKGFRGEWLGGMIADVERLGLMREFKSGAFDRDIYDALYRLADGEKADLSGLPQQAVEMARIVSKYQEDARGTRNRFGSWIRDLKGYITRQSHDMYKIREVSDADWIAFVKDRIDLPKMMRLGLISEADPIGSLRAIYDDFAAGVHMKAVAGEEDGAAFGRGTNLARRESVSRAIYFKDGLAAYEYNQRFGTGTLAESVVAGLDHAARSTALLKNLGTNPEATFTRLLDEYEASLAPDPDRRSKFRSQRGALMNMLAQVDGSVNVPGDVTAAKIGAFTRAWMNMAKLGGALISSFSDLAGYGAELRYGQGKNLLSGVGDGIARLAQGRASGERAAIVSSLGVFHESMLGAISARFDSPDLVHGKMAAAMQQFFRLNGLAWWTETLRDGAALTHSHYMATQAPRAFDKIDPEFRRMLTLYNIDAGKWDILRMGQLQSVDGTAYLTPDGLRTVPRAAFENYIAQVGRTVNDASVQNLMDDLAQALRVMTVDRAHHAVIEPNARTRAWMLRGTKPGTVPGELLRFIGQFKSFSVSMVQMVLGREVYGRGYDTLGEYLRKGHGDMLGLAYMIGLYGALGYGAMAAKDLLKGRTPRDPLDPRTLAAAMAQGGGLGLYGDFLFGEYSRMGRTFTASVAGPVLGNLDTITDLWTRLRNGDDLAAASFKALIDNTPFLNLYWARPVLDYLVLYHIQEALNPGFLRRMEKRIERDNGQTFLLPPSQVVR
jgi:hypothetical protein